MKNTNKESTRYYSDMQETEVASVLEGQRQANSGAGHFNKGDVISKSASILCECKCCMTDRESFSIKKEWIKKNKEESWTQRMDNHIIAFNFGPGQESYYVIDKKLMAFLKDKLDEYYKD